MSVEPQQKFRLSVSVHGSAINICLFNFKLASYLSAAEGVETQQEDMQSHILSEINAIIQPKPDDIETWVREGLPPAFTTDIFKTIVTRFQADGTYVRGAVGGPWRKASLHLTTSPKDDTAVQAAKAEWLNGLIEKVRRTLYLISDHDCPS